MSVQNEVVLSNSRRYRLTRVIYTDVNSAIYDAPKTPEIALELAPAENPA